LRNYPYSPDLVSVEGPDRLFLSGSKRKSSNDKARKSSNDKVNDISLEVGGEGIGRTNSWSESRTERVSFSKSPSDGVVHRKKNRMSVISIASNLFQRKSVDEDALRLMRERSSSERDSSDRDLVDDGILYSVYMCIIDDIRSCVLCDCMAILGSYCWLHRSSVTLAGTLSTLPSAHTRSKPLQPTVPCIGLQPCSFVPGYQKD